MRTGGFFASFYSFFCLCLVGCTWLQVISASRSKSFDFFYFIQTCFIFAGGGSVEASGCLQPHHHGLRYALYLSPTLCSFCRTHLCFLSHRNVIPVSAVQPLFLLNFPPQPFVAVALTELTISPFASCRCCRHVCSGAFGVLQLGKQKASVQS